MEQAPEHDPRVFAEYKRRRTRQLIAIIPMLLVVVPLAMLRDAGPEGLFGIEKIILAPICLAIVVAIIIFSVINWRCPACSGYLGRSFNPAFCEKCGAQLHE